MNSINRRDFLKKGLGCCLLLAGSKSFVFASDEKPNPQKLNYCGYTCPDNCKMYNAGKSDNEELKKEAFNLWKLDKKYGVEYSPEIVFCEQCKKTDNPKSIVLSKCTVRKCAIEKGYECCIECNNLENCDKQLWSLFPDFKKEVIKMQKAYRA